MATIKHNKLVRDLIKKKIEDNGETAVTRILEDDEFLKELHKKLQEEVDEYQSKGEVEELADILEVIYAIAKAKGVDEQELDKIRQQKRRLRGGFDDRVYLVETN